MLPYSETHQGSCLKPIGSIAKLIEAMSIQDYALFIIACGRKERATYSPAAGIIIGKND
jgi:hypothetical protein